MLRLIRFYNKLGDIAKEFWEFISTGLFLDWKLQAEEEYVKTAPLKSLEAVNWLLSFLNKNKKIEQKHKFLSDQIGIVGKSCSGFL